MSNAEFADVFSDSSGGEVSSAQWRAADRPREQGAEEINVWQNLSWLWCKKRRRDGELPLVRNTDGGEEKGSETNISQMIASSDEEFGQKDGVHGNPFCDGGGKIAPDKYRCSKCKEEAHHHLQSEAVQLTVQEPRTQCLIATVPGWNPGPRWSQTNPFRCQRCGKWITTTLRRCYCCGQWPCFHHGRRCPWKPWVQHGYEWQSHHGWQQESFLDAQESCHTPTPTSSEDETIVCSTPEVDKDDADHKDEDDKAIEGQGENSIPKRQRESAKTAQDKLAKEAQENINKMVNAWIALDAAIQKHTDAETAKPAAMQAEAASSSHDPSGDVENKEKDQEAVKKGEEEEALEEEEEEQADENEVEEKQHEFEFKVVAGHGTEMTIVVKRTSKDKAQVLAIRGSTFAGTDWTPRTACQHIAGELQKEAAKVTSPVATCAFLPDLRKLAAAMKQGLCDNT